MEMLVILRVLGGLGMLGVLGIPQVLGVLGVPRIVAATRGLLHVGPGRHAKG